MILEAAYIDENIEKMSYEETLSWSVGSSSVATEEIVGGAANIANNVAKIMDITIISTVSTRVLQCNQRYICCKQCGNEVRTLRE